MRVFISVIGYYKCTWVYNVRICFITFFVYETTKLFLMFRSFVTFDLTHARKYNYKRIISQFSKKLKKKNPTEFINPQHVYMNIPSLAK